MRATVNVQLRQWEGWGPKRVYPFTYHTAGLAFAACLLRMSEETLLDRVFSHPTLRSYTAGRGVYFVSVHLAE